jgi:hypothetical protein
MNNVIKQTLRGNKKEQCNHKLYSLFDCDMGWKVPTVMKAITQKAKQELNE